jgi:hypothetical protein
MKNGLYSLRITMLDGLTGGDGGIMVLRDGNIRGGDSYLYYIGSYTFADGKWKGELTTHEHTPAGTARPIFGGRDIGIGFAGSYDDEGAEALATALSGKRSVRFSAVLRMLAET